MDNCDFCGRLTFLASGTAGKAFCSERCRKRFLSRPPAAASRTIACPYCARDIKAIARSCPHCRRTIGGKVRRALRAGYALAMLYFVLRGVFSLPWPHR